MTIHQELINKIKEANQKKEERYIQLHSIPDSINFVDIDDIDTSVSIKSFFESFKKIDCNEANSSKENLIKAFEKFIIEAEEINSKNAQLKSQAYAIYQESLNELNSLLNNDFIKDLVLIRNPFLEESDIFCDLNNLKYFTGNSSFIICKKEEAPTTRHKLIEFLQQQKEQDKNYYSSRIQINNISGLFDVISVLENI